MSFYCFHVSKYVWTKRFMGHQKYTASFVLPTVYHGVAQRRSRPFSRQTDPIYVRSYSPRSPYFSKISTRAPRIDMRLQRQ